MKILPLHKSPANYRCNSSLILDLDTVVEPGHGWSDQPVLKRGYDLSMQSREHVLHARIRWVRE